MTNPTNFAMLLLLSLSACVAAEDPNDPTTPEPTEPADPDLDEPEEPEEPEMPAVLCEVPQTAELVEQTSFLRAAYFFYDPTEPFPTVGACRLGQFDGPAVALPAFGLREDFGPFDDLLVTTVGESPDWRFESADFGLVTADRITDLPDELPILIEMSHAGTGRTIKVRVRFDRDAGEVEVMELQVTR